MASVRLSLMAPKHGQEKHVESLLGELINVLRGLDGFITAYRLAPDRHDQHGRVGRVTVWESEEAANHAAAQERVFALEAKSKLAADDATHDEHSFQAFPASG